MLRQSPPRIKKNASVAKHGLFLGRARCKQAGILDRLDFTGSDGHCVVALFDRGVIISDASTLLLRHTDKPHRLARSRRGPVSRQTPNPSFQHFKKIPMHSDAAKHCWRLPPSRPQQTARHGPPHKTP